ncbi:MAG: PilZ domain-containing protein [Candidatus Omnitrophica bacterium]|nr:PilZ domain-containing protein [Candidatus Omnitrophota bacterium]
MEWHNEQEKRRFIRTEFPYTVVVTCQGKDPISTYTENISAVGVKVTTRQQFEVTALVDLEIYVSQDPIKCRGKVIWSTARESTCLEDTLVFDSGIEFCDIREKDKFFINQCVEQVLRVKPPVDPDES